MKPTTLLLMALLAIPALPAGAAGPREVDLTWMSIANWYFKLGDVRVVMDGYITRIPAEVFVPSPAFPADRFTYTTRAWPIDVAGISRVHDALSANGRLDFVLGGHSHFDHTYDTATWAALTGAEIIGGLSTCLQAEAQGLPASQCRTVNGGERIDLGHGITMYVVQWNHSGNLSNPIQHLPWELDAVPARDPATGGFRGGVGEDFPNGGGGRAFLVKIDSPAGPVSFFVNNSASAFDLDQPTVIRSGAYDGPVLATSPSPLASLAQAMHDAGLERVDAWIGTGGTAVARLVVPVIRPRAYIPNHWDGLFNSFEGGLPFPYRDDALAAYLSSEGIDLLPQTQYFDTYRLDARGVRKIPNHDVKQKLGFSDVQAFPAATLELAASVTSTIAPDDCQH